MKTLEAPGAERSEALWVLDGQIEPASPSPLYRAGMAAVALAMVLLPLLYLALICAVAYGTYHYAIHGGALLSDSRGRSGTGNLMLYLGPIVIGALVVIFMVKPLFARRPRQREPRAITREEQPELFRFIDRICDLVSAPRPSTVALDMQVNASASFRRGIWSILGGDLTLTIGLPLISGLSLRQFGGVLAHEFGHFAQGGGMRLTYLIRSINGWFARVVYERDAWDEYLAETAGRIDFRIGIILQLARLMIWLTRKILWVFMMVGHAISCFMLRQMEFDADYYETKTSGSRGFAETASRLRQLSVAWHRVISEQQESFQSKRLTSDLASMVAFEAGRLPADLLEALDKSGAEPKTGWFDTHPSDADRVAAAERQNAGGVLSGDASASSLLTEFPQLAQTETLAFYRDECELELSAVRLLAFEETAAEAAALAEQSDRLASVLGPLMTIRTLVFPSGEQIRAAAADCSPRLQEVRLEAENLLQGSGPAVDALLDADRREVLAKQAQALLGAGLSIKKQDFFLKSGSVEGAEEALEVARGEIEKHSLSIQSALAVTQQRLELGLAGIFASARERGDADGVEEIETLLRVLGCLEGSRTTIVELRSNVCVLELLFQNAQAVSDGTRWTQQARRLAGSIEGSVRQVLERCGDIPYPFDHADGAVKLAAFLLNSETHEDDLVRAFIRGKAVVDHFMQIYHRAIGRLAVLASAAEAQLSSEENVALPV